MNEMKEIHSKDQLQIKHLKQQVNHASKRAVGDLRNELVTVVKAPVKLVTPYLRK